MAQPGPGKHLKNTAFDDPLTDPGHPERECHVFEDIPVLEQLEVLEHNTQFSPKHRNLVGTDIVRIIPTDKHPSHAWTVVHINMLEHGRFSRTAGPAEKKKIAFIHGKGDVSYGDETAGILLGHMGELYLGKLYHTPRFFRRKWIRSEWG